MKKVNVVPMILPTTSPNIAGSTAPPFISSFSLTTAFDATKEMTVTIGIPKKVDKDARPPTSNDWNADIVPSTMSLGFCRSSCSLEK
ncbi:unnamed protein product [Pseudo-nitzschia multistriata]|uniref:Uncharacterized protein n=1 Tax=Pseudo-nitzschia multistriata TaxID=183589 RepID=A0A448Z3S6_9STRA|nr:unnamed protein product [Pseudo-nitzschia multistriata]